MNRTPVSDTHKLKWGDQPFMSPFAWDMRHFSFKIGMVPTNQLELITQNGRQV